MSHLRMIKIVLVACVALFAALVAFNNVVDYGSNYAFVEHVLTMDTTFEGNQLKYRAIHGSFLHHAFYWLIILSEVLVGVLCALGAWNMWRKRRADSKAFNTAKTLANLGLTLGVLLWFTGFMTIGAEWFLMWQSQIWNGQASAFRFVVVLFLVLMFINQTEQES
ncbi:DUF2165 family protein [Marinomonas transparens]|uniref:DUF2165 domain-containing protein n=1 Tax=Marinomonas transparens TaxID=2795388 RepID=A0A934JNG0_9GAMM|nr:DUF2165 domain-containing protein [Marinomonas transparens]MBJ7537673.1 DUF2165 domain-containing protein [Marinomonas transparens]